MKSNHNHSILKRLQTNEATAIQVYTKLSKFIKHKKNISFLTKIIKQEQCHYSTLKELTGIDYTANKLHVNFILFMVYTAGITFALKLLERFKKSMYAHCHDMLNTYPDLQTIIEEEKSHDSQIVDILQEERLEYVGSMVLGLNDALVELTGALAGFTFAFRNTRLIALSGLITGIAASLSMASSEFLAHRAKGMRGKAGKAAFYTGIAYILTVLVLILPYLMMNNYTIALICTLALAIAIIFFFNFYISVIQDISFFRHFIEMSIVSLGVATLSFLIGIFVRIVLGIDI